MCTSLLSRSKYPFGKESCNHVLDAGLTRQVDQSPRIVGDETILLFILLWSVVWILTKWFRIALLQICKFEMINSMKGVHLETRGFGSNTNLSFTHTTVIGGMGTPM